ncbi:MoaD/ThiS family protein [Pyrinomonas methylaliphatogenes]|jgi:ferredoxin-nitrite reductase|uniref:Sulfite reductase (Ferredoxin) n=1 Tax=Pyrinomonas methylaliphatogenes TaxID=454194 RepID=A0A0B6WZM0_9BACT|nr:MoaD/ThiS family protein [Pyrinomonas methylaliphatogenes]MBX5478515.1 MoaD/ThiS family protein [Pyrinomonas methylaliphatogenes]CDM66157.1 sulfite reductase (ferredoxin) [Pyrinomonas methylaliphatogenes]
MIAKQTAIGGTSRAVEPTWDLVLKRNSIERMKQEKFPLDIVKELPEMIARGYEAIPEEDIVRLNWWGLTHDKPKVGTFMVRIKVPGGRITPQQLIAVGELSRRYGKNYGELTTRQGIQFHWVRLEELPQVLDAIQAAGLTTVGGEGDTVRNVTSCPVAGVDRDELFDVRPVIAEVVRFFYGNRDYSNLPRKHKYTISACPAQCNAPEIHDVALVGTIKDGRPGFAVRVGGGLSSTPRISRDLGVFIAPEEAVEVLRAITDTWQSNLRYRVSRAKARIKFLVDDYGPEGVRAMVEERLGRRLEDGQAPSPSADTDHLGIHPQKQEGFYYVGVPVPMGWVRGDQLIALGELVGEFAGDVRFTRMQNLIVTGVPEERLAHLARELARIEFEPQLNKVYGRSIACTDHRFCNYSVAETKGKLKEILAELELRFGDAVQDLRIFMDGCPHACAHHWVGDIGLQGTTTTHPVKGVRVEAYDVCLRGGLGTKTAIGKPLLRRLPEDQITEVICRLVGAWLTLRAKRGEDFDFRAFADAHTDDELRAIALGEMSYAVEERAQRPVVCVPGMLLQFSEGADRIEVEARTVREALEALRQRYPRLVDQIVAPDGTLLPSINLFIGEEDVRGLGELDAPLAAGQELIILPALSGG